SCGEGCGAAGNDRNNAERVRCAIDPCHVYWRGRSDAVQPFSANGARASELMGVVLNVQLDRIDGMIQSMRRERDLILKRTASLGNLGLKPAPLNSQANDCATQVLFTLTSNDSADALCKLFTRVVVGKSGSTL